MASNLATTLVNRKFHVLIIGCGLGGLAAAIGIRKAGHDVTILEKAAQLQELGAGINLSPNATRIFKEWDILRTIEAQANVPYAAFMRSYKDNRELSHQQLGHLMTDLYSAPYLVVHRADLHSALLQEARRLDVSIELNSQFTKINFAEPSVELVHGKKYVADVVIGADGERSACRDALLGSTLLSRDSGDHVFRATAKASDIAQHEDIVDLVQPPCINLWLGPGAHAMTYALKRDSLLNIVLTCAHDVSNTIEHGPRKVEIDEVRNAFTQWDPRFQSILDVAQTCSKWTLLETPEPAFWTHPEGNFALLGDSAHAMLPFLGQGAAMAFEDAAVLGTLFSKVQDSSQLPDILSIYEHLRKPRTSAMRAKSRAMRDVYAFEDGPLQRERDRQLQHHSPFDGFANFLADPIFQSFVFSYNAFEDAEKAWVRYLMGEWPSTRGCWDISCWAV
nr:FAD binding domain-containing protein [Cladonia uncialis subsp. uncialis]